MENNFYCPTCNKQFSIRAYITRTREGRLMFFYSGEKVIICNCEDKTELKQIEKPFTGEIPAFGKFSSMDMKGKRESLKTRAKQNFHKEIAEVKFEMLRKKEE